MVQQLQAAGLGPIKGGALYPVLNRLERDGAVTAEWRDGEGGPGRKVFTLTPAGHAHLQTLQEGWAPFAQTVASLLEPSDPAPSLSHTSPTPTTAGDAS